MTPRDEAPKKSEPSARKMLALHRELDACKECPGMIGPVVHGPPVMSRIVLIGQAPGPHEGKFGRPFAWTAGKTLFRWFESAIGCTEEEFRAKVYISAVARCFPGKAKGGGDRKPDAVEIEKCRRHLSGEIDILQPRLVIPVGTLAIEQVLEKKAPLAEVVGEIRHAKYHGVNLDVACLPHPSGASTWFKVEPGRTLLAKALASLAAHPEIVRAFSK